jgi:alkaline phosphatase
MINVRTTISLEEGIALRHLSQKILSLALVGSLAVVFLNFAIVERGGAKKEQKPVKNVIMMVMDGTSAGATTLARWYKGEPLALDEMASGAVRTYSAESAITDSAPAATALATGFKSNDISEYSQALLHPLAFNLFRKTRQ